MIGDDSTVAHSKSCGFSLQAHFAHSMGEMCGIPHCQPAETEEFITNNLVDLTTQNVTLTIKNVHLNIKTRGFSWIFFPNNFTTSDLLLGQVQTNFVFVYLRVDDFLTTLW